MTSIADALEGGSQFIKWQELPQGSTVTGEITSVEMRQARKFQGTDLDFWDDGKPKMQAVVTIQTALKGDADDDGKRALSINLWSGQRKALAEACEKAGVKEPQVGQQFTAKWVSGVGQAGDPRIFEYALTGAASGTVADALGTTPAAASPAAGGLSAEAQAALAGLTPAQKAALGL